LTIAKFRTAPLLAQIVAYALGPVDQGGCARRPISYQRPQHCEDFTQVTSITNINKTLAG
jgi:hypothetical protein